MKQEDRHKFDRPVVAGIYVLVKDDEIIYVGQTADILTRLEDHHYGFGARVYCAECPDLEERKKLEYDLIAEHKPKYNNPDFTTFQRAVTILSLEELKTLWL